MTGYNELGFVGSQGSALSKALNQVPFINATAGLHDYIFNANLLPHTALNNLWTMPASALIAVPAALSDPGISWMTQVKVKNLEFLKPPAVPSIIRIDNDALLQKTGVEGD